MRQNITEKIIVDDKTMLNAILLANVFAKSDFAYSASERQLSADLKWLGDLGGAAAV